MIFCDADNIAGPAGPITPEAIRKETQNQADAIRRFRLLIQQPIATRAITAVKILN